MIKVVNGAEVEMTEVEVAAWQQQQAADTTEIARQRTVRPLAPYQFRAMLKIGGIEQAVNDAIVTIPDANARAVAEAKLECATQFDRADPLMTILAPLVGLTEDEIDQLWAQALQL